MRNVGLAMITAAVMTAGGLGIWHGDASAIVPGDEITVIIIPAPGATEHMMSCNALHGQMRSAGRIDAMNPNLGKVVSECEPR